MRGRSQWMGNVLLVGFLVLVVVGAPSAFASPPGNDAFASADVVAGLPFADSGDLSGTSGEPGEPSSGCLPSPTQTAWYVFTPSSSGSVKVDLAGSDFPVTAVGYLSPGGGLGGLSLVGCSGSGPGSSPMVLAVTAGSTYYLQVGLFMPGPGHLELRIDAVNPPPNDDFAAAEPLTGVFVGASVDLTAATVEPGEPAPGGTTVDVSAWYAYTPATDGALLVRTTTFDPTTFLAVYTGTSLTGLTQLASANGPFPPLFFTAQTGTTYYLQVAQGTFGPHFSSVVSFTVEPVPAPTANFSFFPFDPSTFDTVQFFESSFDPAFVGFGPGQWDFGDGTTAAGFGVSHRYTADSDYTVTLTATTLDGRTATATQIVSVRTHDVAITRIQAPSSARVGQTKTVALSLQGGRYPETVDVALVKSVAGGFDQLVGTRTVAVPAARGGKVTGADFSYTFTPEDGTAGKVTFRAVATIVGARDAAPADNQAIAPPTDVKR